MGAGWGLRLSASDLAKIGELVRCNGKAGGRQIVSEEYIAEMTSAHVKLDERFGNMNYGYLWYQPHEGEEVYAAIGDGRNIIYVNREKCVLPLTVRNS